MVIRAVDSALVLLSSHLNLSSPAFYLWRACLPASSPLESGCLWRLHVALVAFCPCLFLALVCLWPLRYFLVSLARSTCGAHSWGVSLFWVLPPRWGCGWQSPVCVSLGTLHVPGSFAGVGCFLLVFTLLQVCSLFKDWVSCPFLFSQASFVLFFPYPDSLALLCLCGGACRGVLFPRGLPSLAGISVSRS